jgi:hypothetical protein
VENGVLADSGVNSDWIEEYLPGGNNNPPPADSLAVVGPAARIKDGCGVMPTS